MAELLGMALLLYVVVGSGIAAETLGTDAAGQLFAHAVTVGAGPAALIVWLAPVSGAHLNPSVTLAFRRQGDMTNRETVTYVTFQVVGALIGVVVANATFGQPTTPSPEPLGTGQAGSSPSSWPHSCSSP